MKKLFAMLLLASAPGMMSAAPSMAALQQTAAAAGSITSVDDCTFDLTYRSGDVYWQLDTVNNVARFHYTYLREGKLTIPSTVEKDGVTYTVVDIYNSGSSVLYYGGSDITEIELPSTLLRIGKNAFSYCSIKSVSVPEGVTELGDYAFYDCDSLSSVSLPSTLTKIGEYCFNYCKSLKELTIPAGVTSIGSNFVPSGLKKLVLQPTTPPSLFGSFSSDIYKFYVPKGSGAAYYKAAYWQEHVVIDGEGLALTINVDKAGTLGEKVLALTENLSDVNILTLSGTLNSDDIYNIRNRMPNLVEIDMSGLDMTAMPENMFYQRKAIEKIVLPSKLESIGYRAMYGCYSLGNVQLPSTLKSIDNSAFESCYNITEMTLPEGFTSLGSSAFTYCTALKTVTLPTTLKEVTGFTYCTALETVNFAEGLTTIGNSAFSYCYKLKDVVLPSTLTTIESRAFYDCNSLESITLPAALTSCEGYPFYDCDNLTEVTSLSIVAPYVNGYNILYGTDMTGRTLYVPEIALNEYKLTKGWDAFQNIKGIDSMPSDITVWKPYSMELPATLSSDYKPAVNVTARAYNSTDGVGALTLSGSGTLSMSSFKMKYDENGFYDYRSYTDYPCYTSLINNATMRADSVEVEMWNHDNRWVFFTLPFDVKMTDITPYDENTSWVIRTYSGQNRANGLTDSTWVSVPADGTLTAGQGYIMQSERYNESYAGFLFKATDNGNKNLIFANSDRSVALSEYVSEFSHNRSWNLTGNPFPCFYDSRFMEFSAPITVYNEYNETYEAFSLTDDSYILRPGEAFFVQKPVDTDAITFTTEGRQTGRQVRTIETAAAAQSTRAAEAAPREVFNLYLSDGTSTDKARFVINSAASAAYDQNTDAGKFMSLNKGVAQLFTLKDGVRMAINERPMGDGTVSLGAYFGSEGTYTLTLDTRSDRTVTLIDRLTGTETELGEDGYSFTAARGETTDRFLIRMGGTSGVSHAVASDGGIRISAAAGSITVEADKACAVLVCTIDGKTVKAACGTSVKVGVEPGLYIVKAGNRSQKVMVNR